MVSYTAWLRWDAVSQPVPGPGSRLTKKKVGERVSTLTLQWSAISGPQARVALLSALLGDGLPVTAWLRKPRDLLLEAADRLTGHPVGGDRSGHHTTTGWMKSFFLPPGLHQELFLRYGVVDCRPAKNPNAGPADLNGIIRALLHSACTET